MKRPVITRKALTAWLNDQRRDAIALRGLTSSCGLYSQGRLSELHALASHFGLKLNKL